MSVKRRYIIDGTSFSTVAGFYNVISHVLIPNADWGQNFDAFNDILRGGFGTPEEGYIIYWKDSDVSRQALGAADFNLLVEIINVHCAGGSEANDGVELVLA